MSTHFFESRLRWGFERAGTQRMLPYFYYDMTFLAGVFLASTSRIKALLPHPEMRPVELVPGQCAVAVAAFEYRRTSGEPYNEVSVSFLITFGQRQIPAISAAGMMLSRVVSSYVWQLPVTTEHARAGGVDLFGYPKFIADIDFLRDNDWVTCTLAEGGHEILRLTGRRLATRPGKLLRFVTYSMVEGSPLIAEVLVNPLEYAQTVSGRAVELELGTEHQVGRALAQIGLGNRALVYQYGPTCEAILFPARNVMGTDP